MNTRRKFIREFLKSLPPLAAQVADIRCNMLTKPVVSGLGTSCNPIITPTSFGWNGVNGCGSCNGNNVLV